MLTAEMQADVMCRVCLLSFKDSLTHSIYKKWQPPWFSQEEKDAAPTIAETLAGLANTKIEETDTNPKQLCLSCFQQFWRVCLFLHRVRFSENLLRKQAETGTEEKKTEDAAEEPSMTITSALQLSKSQYDNIGQEENGNKEVTETQSSNVVPEEPPKITIPEGNPEINGDIAMDFLKQFDEEMANSQTEATHPHPEMLNLQVEILPLESESVPDWKGKDDMARFMELYKSEWIDCKDVYTTTEDFAEYLGIKIEEYGSGLMRTDGRMLNGFHSELMFDSEQIKNEPVSEDEEMLMVRRLRQNVDRRSPQMDTEWLEDYQVDDASDSETAESGPQECMLCSKQFLTVTGLKAHVISSHSYRTVYRMSLDNLTVDPQDPKSHQSENWCKYCSIYVSNLTQHMEEVKHTIRTCNWCSSTFGNDRLLYTHTLKCPKRYRSYNGQKVVSNVETSAESVHAACIGTVGSLVEKVPQYKCPHCNEMFVNSEYLSIHEQAFHSPATHDDDGGDDMEALQMEIDQGGT